MKISFPKISIEDEAIEVIVIAITKIKLNYLINFIVYSVLHKMILPYNI